MAASIANLASTDFANHSLTDLSEPAVGRSTPTPGEAHTAGHVQSPIAHNHSSPVSGSHWLFDWLDTIVSQTLWKLLDHSKFSSSAVRNLASHLGFPTRLACAVYHYLPDTWFQLPLTGKQNYPVCLDHYLEALINGVLTSTNCEADDRVNSGHLSELFQNQQIYLPNRRASPQLTAHFAQTDLSCFLSRSVELRLLSEFHQWIVPSQQAQRLLVPLQTVPIHRTSSSTVQSTVAPSSTQTGVLQSLVKRAGTVARAARPAHPNSRPIALLNTAAVEQLVHSTTHSDPMDATPTPRVDSPQTPTSSTCMDALQQNGLGGSGPAHDLLTELVLAAARGEDAPPLPTEANSGKGGFYVNKQPPESITTSSDMSPPESVENSTIAFDRNKMYATFCKRPTPEFSNKLPVIASPARVASPPNSTPTVSPKSSVPSLRSEFEKRKRSRSSLPAEQAISTSTTNEDQVPPPGTTTWAAAGNMKTSHRKLSAPSNTADSHISSTSGVSDHTEKPVSRSSAAALRLSLDQRRRAIEMGRQRALLATNKAAAQRHHAAFQKLLQNEQRRRGKKPEAPEPREKEATSEEPPSQCLNDDISSSSPAVPLPTEPVTSGLSNGIGALPHSNPEDGTDIEDEFSTRSSDAHKLVTDNITTQQPEQSTPSTTSENRLDPEHSSQSTASPKTASSPEPTECIETSQAYPDESVIDQRSSPVRALSDSSHSGSDPADCTLPSVTSEPWYHSGRPPQAVNNMRRPRQSTPHTDFDSSLGDYPVRDPPGHRVRRHSPRPAPSSEYIYPDPKVVQQLSFTRSRARPSHIPSHSPTRVQHAVRSGPHRNDLISQSMTSGMLRRAGRTDHPEPVRSSRHHHLTTSANWRHDGHMWEPEEGEEGAYEEVAAPYDYDEDDDEEESESDAELEERSNYSRGRWGSDRYSERSFPTSRVPAYAYGHPRSSHHRRHASPIDSSASGRRHKHADRQDVNAMALEQLNRNLIGLQTGLERLLATGPNASQAVGDARLEGQQAPAQIISSHTSLTGTTRATWSERPKLRDLSSGRPMDITPEPIRPALSLQTSAVAFEESSTKSDSHAPESHVSESVHPSAPSKTPAPCAFSVDMTSGSPAEPQLITTNGPDHNASQPSNAVPKAPEPTSKEAENRLFFIAFDEPDPQRMQRKCDQLEARRAAEKALVAQQLQALRSQDREVRMATDQAQLERRANEREKREAILQAYKEKHETNSNSPRASELYPVRPGSAALSRSEANIAASPRDRRAASQSVAPTKRGAKQPANKARPTKSAARRNSLTKSSTSLHSSSAALRGNADGEAVETSDGDIESDGTRKKSRANGAKPGARLPSGLSLSSLHRLGCSDSPSSGPGLQVSNSAQPKLFVKPKAKSNRMVIVNAIGHACLAGAVNEPMKQATLKELAATEGTHFMILFRDSRCQYRAVYSFDLELEELRLICGTGPRRITHEMANRFFKYNSGGKHFTEITSTNHLSPVVDAITIHEALWSKASGQAAALNLLSGRN